MSPKHSPEFQLDASVARFILLVALALFLVQGWSLAGSLFVYNEELVGHAALPASELVVEKGTAQVRNICDGGSRFAYSTVGDPHLVLCAGGLAWPILVNPYIGGIHYWPLQLLRPLHHGDPIVLRRIALSAGVIALVVLFLLVETVGDSLQAASTVAVTAVFPTFVLLHSVLIFFELVPGLLVAAAALVIARRPNVDVPPAPRLAIVAGAVFGLAVFASIKAAVIGAPLIVFALFASPVLRRTSSAAWIAAATAGGVVLLPMIVAIVADPSSGFGQQLSFRLAAVASRLNLTTVLSEVFNLLVCAADMGIFQARALGEANLWLPTLIMPAIALIYSVIALIRAVRGLSYDCLAAATAVIQLVFLVFVWLAYTQLGGNYLAIGYAQAVAAGCVIAAAGRTFARRGGNPWLAIALVGAVTIVPAFANIVRRGDSRNVPLATNVYAEQQLGDYLKRHDDRALIVTGANLFDVAAAFSGQPELRLDRSQFPCQGVDNVEACERDVFVAVSKRFPQARFLVPLRSGIYDKDFEPQVMARLEAAARVLGGQLREEAHFDTRLGVPVIALVDIQPGSDFAPSTGPHLRPEPSAQESYSQDTSIMPWRFTQMAATSRRQHSPVHHWHR